MFLFIDRNVLYSHQKTNDSLVISSSVGRVYLESGSLYISDFLIEILNRLKELRWQTSPFVIESRESSDLFYLTRTAKLYSDNLTPFESHVRSRTEKSQSALRMSVEPEGADLTEGFTSSTS